jgi:RES domain
LSIITTHLEQDCWRIIPSQYPAINIYETVTDPEDLEAVVALESMTNPRIRDEIGQLELVDIQDRITGAGVGYIMAAFTHCNPLGSRFSDGSYGVYYAGNHIDTAISETIFHRTRFMQETDQAPSTLVNRVLTAKLNSDLHDVRGMQEQMPEIYHVADYTRSQEFARLLREQRSWGIAYSSVRHEGGECFAVLRPPALSNCRSDKHLGYVWDGIRIRSVFEMDIYF